MGQLAITELKWSDFVVWTRRGINVQRIEFSPQIWEFMQEKLNALYLYGFVTELFTDRIKQKKVLYF